MRKLFSNLCSIEKQPIEQHIRDLTIKYFAYISITILQCTGRKCPFFALPSLPIALYWTQSVSVSSSEHRILDDPSAGSVMDGRNEIEVIGKHFTGLRVFNMRPRGTYRPPKAVSNPHHSAIVLMSFKNQCLSSR